MTKKHPVAVLDDVYYKPVSLGKFTLKIFTFGLKASVERKVVKRLIILIFYF